MLLTQADIGLLIILLALENESIRPKMSSRRGVKRKVLCGQLQLFKGQSRFRPIYNRDGRDGPVRPDGKILKPQARVGPAPITQFSSDRRGAEPGVGGPECGCFLKLTPGLADVDLDP